MDNVLSVFLEKMVKQMMMNLMRNEHGERQLFIDCGRQNGHSTAAYDLCIKLNSFFDGAIIVIGIDKESLHKFSYNGFKTFTANQIKTNLLLGVRSSLVIVDSYKYVKGIVPDIEERIKLTSPIFTVYLQ